MGYYTSKGIECECECECERVKLKSGVNRERSRGVSSKRNGSGGNRVVHIGNGGSEIWERETS